jgi:DNA polymerase (family X)
MPVPNSEVARIFEEYADLLEIYGANEYRVQAYRTAARNVSYLAQNLSEMVKRGEDLTTLPGIAKDLAGKITQIVKTNHLSQLDELKRTIPEELVRMTRIAGLGPRRSHFLYYGVGIHSIRELEKAARAGEIKDLPGFGIKTEQSILTDIERRGPTLGGARILYSEVDELVQPLLAYLSEAQGVLRIDPASEYRRGSETVRNLDIVAAAERDSEVMERFLNYDELSQVVFKGQNHSAVRFYNGFQVDLHIVPQESYGTALISFTGSKAHVDVLRRLGSRRRLQVNENGVFKREKLIAGQEEAEVYEQVGLPYIEPELRENRGEIEAARSGNLPDLITLKDIRGDLHVHTALTDGRSSLEEMAYSAQEKGYEYLAITEHSQRLTISHGLNKKRLAELIEQIDKLNEKLTSLVLLKSLEVDILDDGSLDLPHEILKELDLVICGVHHKFHLSREKQTERIIRAMHNPYFMILAHPSGRLINDREPYDVDMERLIQAAGETGCVIELNSQPERLDLEDVYCKMAKDLGVKIAISSDAHSTSEMNFMQYGVIQGRRGWLEIGDVINTLRWEDFREELKKPRKITFPNRQISRKLPAKTVTLR